MVNNLRVIEKYEHFHYVAEKVQFFQRLEVLCHFHQRYELSDVVFANNKFCEGISPLWCGGYAAHCVFNIFQIAYFWLWEYEGVGSECIHGIVR